MEKLLYPFLRGVRPKPNCLDQYYLEPNTLGEKGIYALLDKGKEIAAHFDSPSGIIFPHTFLTHCGEQIAAAVHACLDGERKPVLSLGVFHPMTPELVEARSKELNRENILDHPSRGVLKPDSGYVTKEFSLMWFKLLMKTECHRRGIDEIQVIERYPSLCNRDPANLPGIEELQELAQQAFLVSSDDLLHHGVAYGVETNDQVTMNEAGLDFSRREIEKRLSLLEKGDYEAYYMCGMNPLAIGDPTDATSVMRYLIGPSSATLINLKLVDVSSLFQGDPNPSWVATAVVQLKGK